MKTSGQKQFVISLSELPTRWTPHAGMGNATEVFGAPELYETATVNLRRSETRRQSSIMEERKGGDGSSWP